jgi:thymidylate kinase
MAGVNSGFPTSAMAEGLREQGAERALAEALAGGVAFLRHRVAGLEHRESSDWDLAVKDAAAAGEVAEASFGCPLLRVERRYVTQRYFDWGQLDFLPCFEWNGIEYLDPVRFWDGVRPGDDGLPRPRVAHDAFVAWMTGLLWGGKHGRRYEDLLKRALEEDAEEFEACLREAFGAASGEALMRRVKHGRYEGLDDEAGSLRRALLGRNLGRAPMTTLRRVLRHWVCELRHHVKPPFPWIALLGPDGSGKSSVIAGLMAKFRAGRIGVLPVHWRPTVRRKSGSAPVVTDPHGREPRGFLLSIAKTGLLVLRWQAALAWPLRHVRAKHSVLLCDRYFDDLTVDPRRYRFGAAAGWARAMFRVLPRPDRVLFLLGPAETIHGRKQEVPMDELRRQLAAYRELAGRLGPRALVLDAGLPLEEVVEQAWAGLWAGGPR